MSWVRTEREIPAGVGGEWQAWWFDRTDQVPAPAAAQGFVLTTGQLRDAGCTRSAVRTAVRRQRWSVPSRGVVAVVDVRGGDRFAEARRRHATVATAAALVHPRHAVGARSAAVLHGLPTLVVPDEAELLAPDGSGLGRSSVHRYGGSWAACDLTAWFGVPVTDVARTVVDLARHDRRDGLMAADAALRADLVDRARIERALASGAGWPGIRQARAVLALADPLAESPLESLARLRLHDAGFPRPRLQVVVAGYRIDMVLGDRLAVEVDGRSKYTADELWREKRREHVLRGEGLVVERLVRDDLGRSWPQAEQRLWRAYRAAHASSPSVWS